MLFSLTCSNKNPNPQNQSGIVNTKTKSLVIGFDSTEEKYKLNSI